jgi:regulator of sirC expression with transglutaminase-like and TPR domain
VELTERFADVVAREPLPLDEAVTLIGAHADPSCDVDGTLRRLDRIAADVPGAGTDAVLDTVFGTLGFTGDQRDYHDPRNSFLHEVLERRRGIPVTLSIVLIEVARRVGVTIHGIGTPAHFLSMVPGDPPRYVDAFAGGRVLDRAELDGLFAALAPGVDLDPHLVPLTGTEIVRRVLGNLLAIHRRTSDRDALLWSTQLRTLVPGSSPDDQRTFGGALAACGDFVRAAKVLESLADRGDAPDPERTLAEARQLRARLN